MSERLHIEEKKRWFQCIIDDDRDSDETEVMESLVEDIVRLMREVNGLRGEQKYNPEAFEDL